MRNGLAPSHQQFKPNARRASIARQVSVTAFLAQETVFNLVRAPQRTVLDPDNQPLINRRGCEVAHRDSLSGQYLLAAGIPVCQRRWFSRTCCRDCNDTSQAPFRPVAFGLGPYCWPRHTPWNFVSCRTITQLHERCSTLREAVMAWHRCNLNRRGGRRSR